MSPYVLTSRKRNTPHRSSLVGLVIVAEAVAVVGTVHFGRSVASVPVSSVLGSLSLQVVGPVSPAPASVAVFLNQAPPALELDAPRSQSRPGDNRRVRSGFWTAAPPVASMGGLLFIAGGSSLPVCRGRAPYTGSLRSSLLVVYLSGHHRYHYPENQESLFLSSEGIVTSSSSERVPESTVSSSDSFNPPISCCIIILAYGEKFSSLHSALPLIPPKVQS